MKILAINGSPRGKQGNTEVLIRLFLDGCRQANAETIYLNSKNIHSCSGCFTCWTKHQDNVFIMMIVMDILFSIMLIVSILVGHLIIQVIAEQGFLNNVPKTFKEHPKYQKNWIILTVAWAVIKIIQTIVRVILLKYFSIEIYYTVSSLYSGISMPLCIAGSIIFSKRYLHH